MKETQGRKIIFAFRDTTSLLECLDEVLACVRDKENVRIYIKLDKRLREEAVSALCNLAEKGVSILWSEHLLENSKVTRYSEDKELKLFPVSGYFGTATGTFRLLQKLPRSPPDLDIFFRISTESGVIPFFTYSDLLPGLIRKDSIFKIAYIINFSEHCTRGLHAPSELFNEALAFQTEEEGSGESVEMESIGSLLQEICKPLVKRAKGRRAGNEERISHEFQLVVSEFTKRGYYLDPRDESTIYSFCLSTTSTLL